MFVSLFIDWNIGRRWLWRTKWKEPALLLAPISPHSRTDDMRMSVTIGVHTPTSQCADLAWRNSNKAKQDSQIQRLADADVQEF